MLPRALLPAHEAEWIAAQFADFTARFGEDYRASRRLILPTRDYFSAPKGADHATARAVFDEVKAHLELGEDWPVRFTAQEPAPPLHMISDWTQIAHDQHPPLATFRIDESGPLITYDPDLPKTPRAFITTMAHELAHYMMAAYPSPEGPFDEPKLEEVATDLLVYYTGFGVIAQGSLFSATAGSDAFSQMWHIQNRNYISRESGAFALALFLRLNDIESDSAIAHFDRHNGKLLTRALRQLDRSPDLLARAQSHESA